MKRFRVGLLGFGWAVLAGPGLAADGDWHPVGGSAPPTRVVPVAGEPAPLPAGVRAGTPVRAEPEPIWLPAVGRAETSGVVRAQSGDPAPRFEAQVTPVQGSMVGPRVGAVPQPPDAGGPEFLPPPQVNRQPAVQVPPAELPPPRPADPRNGQPRPMPKPVPPGGIMPIPQPPDMIPPGPPGAVRPVTPQPYPPVGELPVAPPELMIPAGTPVPGRHGTFGSPPLRLSRDYPSLADLHGGADRFGGGFPTLEDTGRAYVQAEYLLWWMKGLDIPVLATTNTRGGFGFLGEPGTVPVVGPGEFIGPLRHGFRARAGWWVNDCRSCAIDGSFFFLGRKTASTVLTSDRFGIITRPVFSPNPRPGGGVIGETGEAVTVPGILTGSLSAEAESVIWGFDANVRKCLFRGCDAHLTWFVGYRNVNLEESVRVTENITVVGPGGSRVSFNDPVGSVVVVRDSFATRNYFHGGQIGGTYERRWGRVLLDVRASVAFGATHQELEIDGSQVRTRPGMAPMTFRGGLLAAGPNLGTFTRDKFSVVPEATVNLGYQVTPRLRAYVGYNFLYWSNVIRPGDQIDRVVDLSFVPNAPVVTPSGQNRPRPLFRQSDLWVNGVQFGLEFRW